MIKLLSKMSRAAKNLQDGFIKFHGCGIYHRDGSNVLITKRRGCSNPINACFWMQGEHVHKKVSTRQREYDATVYYTPHLKKQYQSELNKQNPDINFYSTDDETMSTMSVTDSDVDSYVPGPELTYDSDDNRLIIDIENVTKSNSQISNTISNRLATDYTVNSINQVPHIKTHIDQTLGSQNEFSQTPDRLQTTNDKSIPCTILL